MPPCELCGHVYGQLHRVRPGCWGGDYDDFNVAYLCPNHHAAVHLFMKWYYGKKLSPEEAERFEEYHTDRALKLFWLEHAKPAVRQRLVEEGRWHPYVRTLPPPPVDRRNNRQKDRQAKQRLRARKARS
jgi:hypothetical protein